MSLVKRTLPESQLGTPSTHPIQTVSQSPGWRAGGSQGEGTSPSGSQHWPEPCLQAQGSSVWAGRPAGLGAPLPAPRTSGSRIWIFSSWGSHWGPWTDLTAPQARLWSMACGPCSAPRSSYFCCLHLARCGILNVLTFKICVGYIRSV